MEPNSLLSPVVQYGFAGVCAVLLAMIFWLVNRLLGVLGDTNRIVEQNTAAIRDLSKQSHDQMELMRGLHDKLLSRPCILDKEC